MSKINICVFNRDLRISDNPAFFSAAKDSKILPVFIFGDDEIGRASKLWLHHSLKSLNESLGGKLNFYCGETKEIIAQLIAQHDVDTVFWNRNFEPARILEDAEIKKFLTEKNIQCKTFNASLLWHPKDAMKSDDSPYKVFTPFYRNTLKQKPPRIPLPIPPKMDLLKDQNSKNLDDLQLLPQKNWHKKIEKIWQIGEAAAQKKMLEFLGNGLKNYREGRDLPAINNVSKLSPHLHFGEISPNQVWYSVQSLHGSEISTHDIEHFLREMCWRDFSAHMLYHFRSLPTENFQPKFNKFPWQKTPELLQAWQRGQTGYPIVDAGMRELWQTGFMHNRVRMIVGSFLVKNLLQHWHEGAAWFFDCLLDADLASNSGNWQWVAGSGADAAPYFRIFNPILQGEKFDADGEYTKRFVPELKNLPKKYLFKPWTAPTHILQAAGVTLGKNYPSPIVDLSTSRDQALFAYSTLRDNVF